MGLDMAVNIGVFLRKNKYYLRVMLPKEHPLHAHYKSGKVVISLEGQTFREAQLEASFRRAEVLSNQFVIPKAKKQGLIIPITSRCYLRDVYERWVHSQTRSHDSIIACKRSLALYEEFTLNPYIKDLTRDQGDGFRSWLQHPDRKTASKTARDRLIWVQSLLNYATVELELLPRNPWQGINLKYSTTEKRRPWTEGELRILFSSEVFTKDKPLKDWRAGSEAAYWLPILGLYTGARISELTQLKSCDIKSESDISYIEITNDGVNQKLKTAASNRKIPVHSLLIKLGFMGYVKRIQLANHDSLWPKLPMRTNKAGGYFSNWFGEYRGKIGLGGYPDFHCFRHSVRTKLLEADIKEQVIDMIVGHEIRGSTGAKVYSHRTLATLRDAIEKLTYESAEELLTLNLHRSES